MSDAPLLHEVNQINGFPIRIPDDLASLTINFPI